MAVNGIRTHVVHSIHQSETYSGSRHTLAILVYKDYYLIHMQEGFAVLAEWSKATTSFNNSHYLNPKYVFS